MKQRVPNWTRALFASVLIGIFSPAWGEMYEWCDPATGALRLGDQPPAGGIRFWLEGNRPEPITRDGKQQSSCVPRATPEAPPASALVYSPPPAAPPSQSPSPDTATQAALERQKRNAEILGNLVRQTPQYQEGGLVDYGRLPAHEFEDSVLVLHRGSRDEPQPNDSDADKTVHVRGYLRKDGTYVNEHWRSPPSR